LITRSIEDKHPAAPQPTNPRNDQNRAINAAKTHFLRDQASRGRLTAPCGTGKGLLGFWIAQALEARTIVVLVPSLDLIEQGVSAWMSEFLARGQTPEWICVCSDDSVDGTQKDEFVSSIYDTGLPVDTDPQVIAAFLRRHSDKTKVIFCTYHSGERLADAVHLAGETIDLAIFDEAHRTVGLRDNAFASLLDARRFEVRWRLFMTATERVVRFDHEDNVFSMDNEKDYGQRFFNMTFKEAIDLGIISDYEILVMAVSDSEIKQLIIKNRLLNLNHELTEAEARLVATGIALKRVFQQHRIGHAISFHRSIEGAKKFCEQQDKLNDMPPYVNNFHVNGGTSAGKRKQILDEFRTSTSALVTNARCLQEGVDIPAIDCVVFVDPRQSTIDITQAVGRAMRKADGKVRGYILVPIIVPEDIDDVEAFAETTAFRAVMRVVAALSTVDDRIVDELRAIRYGRTPTGRIIHIDGTLPIGLDLRLEKFAQTIDARLWERIGRIAGVYWRPFAEAREFVRSLGFKSLKEWWDYCRSGGKPKDIPIVPHAVYANDGWVNWPDWLGNSRRTPNSGWRPFEEARAFVRSLGFTSTEKWNAYCRSGKKPNDIPAASDVAYANDGWVNWPDWLGNSRRTPNSGWRPFEEARAFVRSLGLKSGKEWEAYRQSNDKSIDIPAAPYEVYANDGWVNWPDWLGNGRSPSNSWRPFEEARAFVRNLKLKSQEDWYGYCLSGTRPNDIPSNPDKAYANDGWAGMSDWLGNGQRAHVSGWRSFEEARGFVGGLGIKSQTEWYTYCRSNNKPIDIPTHPNRTYANDGWVNWPNWLGNGRRSRNSGWQPFEEARTFMRSLRLNSAKEWYTYCLSGTKPNDIPSNPDKVYANDGWAGISDWLGYDWRPFEEARAFVRDLRLKSEKEWRTYCLSDKQPNDIPTHPNRTYANDGWVSWPDWLGNGQHGRPHTNTKPRTDNVQPA
jgi:superfamily II DNA or RNA helicase